ncbi:hypothetical protein L1987_85667 [Smallanthus sonchifolius]|uniref:Uncharacterized protein n=1 Tax=Smallanthus sonchifolius TaxID=185202 RepID=A0ACB8XYS0_9ASTR|nr:hypothetical protein L1987_85667 [Smallanthus sonchifolius]
MVMAAALGGCGHSRDHVIRRAWWLLWQRARWGAKEKESGDEPTCVTTSVVAAGEAGERRETQQCQQCHSAMALTAVVVALGWKRCSVKYGHSGGEWWCRAKEKESGDEPTCVTTSG